MKRFLCIVLVMVLTVSCGTTNLPTPTFTPKESLVPVHTPTSTPTLPMSIGHNDSFFLGSTKDDVLAIQGPPTNTANIESRDYWWYAVGGDHHAVKVVFDNNHKVIAWTNWKRGLKLTSFSPQSRQSISIGATKEDVLAKKGTPAEIVDNSKSGINGIKMIQWSYGDHVHQYQTVSGLRVVFDPDYNVTNHH